MGWEGKSGCSQRLGTNSYNVTCSNATCGSILKCYHKQKKTCHLGCTCHEHNIASLHSKFPWGPFPKPSNAGDWDMLHLREASDNQGSSSGCYWQRSVENCFIKGPRYKLVDQKSNEAHSITHAAGRSQANASYRLLDHWLDGDKRCTAELCSWTDGFKDNDDITPLGKKGLRFHVW